MSPIEHATDNANLWWAYSYCWPWHVGVSNMDSESNKEKRCLVYKKISIGEYYRKRERKLVFEPSVVLPDFGKAAMNAVSTVCGHKDRI